ncbi:amidohydrolase family protein [Aureimonas fodinaquatilis]|uniref:Amidohydrolase family protein n=1 Tax=Aureimonas fodinaquatilis TaxID=2565783 RepID=A0A5B0DUE7_9HYPH|nr:amidohydrolase family protein [Aureimonas fodinaquatilis]KAA0969401.1 amidohydrolase family protein [Aureimonas fodinaquatilis]
MRIDSHHHFWRLEDRVGEWPPADLVQIYRDFSVPDLDPLLKQNGIHGTVLVQTLPRLADTHYMLGIAQQNSFVKGVVGWADLLADDAAKTIEQLATNPKLKGLRPMLQDLPDAAWIANPALQPAVDAMLASGLSFDALAKPPHLQPLLTFARRNPDLAIVIDHGGKPDIAGGNLEMWKQDMRALADLPHIHCKLSGLMTEAGSPPDMDGVAYAADTVLDLFGPQRTMFGSDWPVLNLAGTYSGWLEFARDRVARQFGEADEAAIFGGNAVRFYRLEI